MRSAVNRRIILHGIDSRAIRPGVRCPSRNVMSRHGESNKPVSGGLGSQLESDLKATAGPA
jgi:hypothetical protein